MIFLLRNNNKIRTIKNTGMANICPTNNFQVNSLYPSDAGINNVIARAII